MDILIASVVGYLLGGASVLLTMFLLYDKIQPKAEQPAPEPKEREEPEEQPEMSPEEKQWLAEIEALWNYDGKMARGGVMNGDKENSGGNL